jgi:hypothetical protein
LVMAGRRIIVTLIFAALALACAAEARAAGFFEKNFWLSGPRYDAVVPLCDNGWVQSKIRSRFSHKEGKFWNSELTIVGFEDIRETTFNPWRHGSIPRRFCRAVALVSDGIRRPVYYSIAEDLGEIGFKWGVEWCVDGLDRNWAYAPRCRMAKP